MAVDGWDNRTYRLGEDMTVRLPTAAGYACAVDKECVHRNTQDQLDALRELGMEWA
ncbi:hypothetical protein [Streptomyces scopuliridis]|uniref:hypothetical protein n=1 Tax=Streptomyces scopuliridis TaxID=452529 RepID=UPI003899AD1B